MINCAFANVWSGCSFNEMQFSGTTVGWNLLHMQVPGIFAVNNGLEKQTMFVIYLLTPKLAAKSVYDCPGKVKACSLFPR